MMLVDDHAIVRAGLKSLFDWQEDMKVVCEADNTSQVMERIQDVQPSVLVLDLTMPGGGSLDLVRMIRSHDSSTKVLIFTMHDDPAYARSALAAGAAGYEVKTVGEQEFSVPFALFLAVRYSLIWTIPRRPQSCTAKYNDREPERVSANVNWKYSSSSVKDSQILKSPKNST
jgi:DNA-binding NarL/FixJ family response regulator